METRFTLKTAPACLWMQAGVVSRKYCAINFDCPKCRFDRAMKRVCHENAKKRRQGRPMAGNRGKIVYWIDRMRTNPLAKRPCIHHMKGHINFKTCHHAYRCIDCEFDQYFHDQFKIHTMVKPIAFDDIHGISLPAGYYLHYGHTWIKLEGQGMVRVGIDDFAGRLLGKFDRLDIPVMGKALEQGKPAFTLYRTGNGVSFLSPVNGVITAVNTRSQKHPAQISAAPYTDGWLLMLHCPLLKQDLKQLLFMGAGRGFMETEVKRLYAFLEAKTDISAADGGTLVSDLYGSLSGISWQILVNTFIPQDF